MVAPIDDNQTAVLEEALTRFIDDYLRGEHPDIEEFIAQYPECEAQLKERIQDLQEIYTLFDSLVHADESDFEDSVIESNLIGRRIRSFEITKLIGRGGMGVVYLARDAKLERQVAIKCMPTGLLSSSKAQARFKSEAKLLASLNHPNIAVIYEIIEDQEGISYLVLEYVPGETLNERITREPLELEDALSISSQIADAVSAAHKKDIIHKDLKPGNIKITSEGRVKVLDFGLAKTYDRDSKDSETAAIQPGRVIGTPAYMSPEQAEGKETDHRTDTWSFGCIMFEMLTGRHPFESETAKDTMESIIKSQPDWNLLPESTPSNILTLLRRCLEKNPNQRLGDISDAAIEINETLNKPQTKPISKLLKAVTIFSAIILIILFAIILRLLPKNQGVYSSKEIRLAVLPYKHDGSVKNEDVTAGITIEITTLLAKIRGLSVISHLSAIKYKYTNKNVQQIARELRADYIMEGTVQYEHPMDPNSPVIGVKSRLTKTSDGTLVWSKKHNNIFQVNSDLAWQVAQALDITLPEPERQLLASIPTKNTEAYIYYMQGIEYSSRMYQYKENPMIAIQMYEKAVGLDENFALAYARLSEAHSGMYHFSHDRSEERLMMAWEASEKALKLDPELPEAHWARGVYYYWDRSDHARALDELTTALKSQPKNSQLFAMIGYVQRAQGKFEQALTNLKRAFKLNPRDFKLAYELGNIYRRMGRYPEAEPYYEQAILLAPDEYFPYHYKIELYLLLGNTQKARDTLDRASDYINLDDEWRAVILLFELDVLDRKYEEAFGQLPLASSSIDELIPQDVLRYAQIYGYMGDRESEKKFYDKARSILEAKVEEDPNNAFFHAKLGVAFASLGRKEDAIQSGKKGLELLRNSNTARDMAHIYMMVGKFDSAIKEIEYMLSIPAALSIPLLKIDPLWDPLRDHPRFKKLIEPNK